MSILSGIGQIPSVYGGGGGLTPSSTRVQTSGVMGDGVVNGGSFNLSNFSFDNVSDPRYIGLVAGKPYHVAVQIQIISEDGACNSGQLDGNPISFDFQWELLNPTPPPPSYFSSVTLTTTPIQYGLGTTPPILLDQTLTIPTDIPANATFILDATGNIITNYPDGLPASACINLFYTPATTN